MVKVQLRGRAIRKMLAQRNRQQKWLAAELGITSGYMAQLLNGDRGPSPELRQKIQMCFEGKSFHELFSIQK